jgi:spermidine/putrescine-binding protein
VGSFAALTSAIMANGSYEAAIGWGFDMAEHASKVTGIPTTFAMPQYGPFGAVVWIAVTEDAAAADAGNAALNGDADYIKKLGAAGDLFVEGSGMRMLATRIA